MSKPRSPDTDNRGAERIKAERIYLDSGGEKKLVDIATELNLPANKIRKWKSLDDWDGKLHPDRKKKSGERSTKGKGSVPPKRGAPKGNQNAKGGRGNPHPVPPDNTKHGAYRPVFMDTLDDDEQELVDTVPDDEERLLIEQIQLFSIRERRIMQAINKYRNQSGEVAVMDVTRLDTKRSFTSQAEEDMYRYRQQAKVNAGEKLPGEPYTMQTHTSNKDMIVARLEQELSTVQRSKTKAIETLYKLRMERQRMDLENSGNSAVDDWIKAIIGEE